MLKQPKLSIVVVNYNTRELLLSCLNSLRLAKTKSDIWEIIVVDNASTDGSAVEVQKHFPETIVIKNRKNLGFAKANNQGIGKTYGEYILLLNSDTQVYPGSIQHMLSVIKQDEQIGVATCKLVLEDGRLDPACHRGFPTPWAAFTYMIGLERLFPQSQIFGQYHQGYKNMQIAHEIDCPVGAFFLIRRKVIECVGLLDEDYFMYGEDIDWSYRIKKSGYKIFFDPQVAVLHLKKRSGRANESRRLQIDTQVYFYQTMKIFYRKHYQKIYPNWLTVLIQLLLSARIVLLRRVGI